MKLMSIGISTLQRIKGAMGQVESDVLKFHVDPVKPTSTAERKYPPSRLAILP